MEVSFLIKIICLRQSAYVFSIRSYLVKQNKEDASIYSSEWLHRKERLYNFTPSAETNITV